MDRSLVLGNTEVPGGQELLCWSAGDRRQAGVDSGVSQKGGISVDGWLFQKVRLVGGKGARVE